MITSLLNFKEWRVLNENSPTSILFSYLKRISQDPHVDDLLTLGNMLAKLPKEITAPVLSDLWPGISEILKKLPPTDASKVINHFTNLKLGNDANRYWLLSNNKKFASLNDFEDFLSSEMGKNNPYSVAKMIKQNKTLWQSLDDNFQQQVIDWLKEKETEENNRPKFLDVIQGMLKNPPSSEE